MRRAFAVCLVVAAFPLAAAAQQQPPLGLEPIPAPPPPPVGIGEVPEGAAVTIRPEDKVERFEADGQVYFRVTPADGTEYYIIEARPGDAPFAGAQSSDTRVRAPMWRVFSW